MLLECPASKTKLWVNGVTEEFEGDKRTERTRSALCNAFFELVLSQPYSRIKIADIIAKADVGRSTFYVPVSAIAQALAATQLSLLSDWLTGVYATTPDKLAQQLMLTSRAIAIPHA